MNLQNSLHCLLHRLIPTPFCLHSKKRFTNIPSPEESIKVTLSIVIIIFLSGDFTKDFANFLIKGVEYKSIEPSRQNFAGVS